MCTRCDAQFVAQFVAIVGHEWSSPALEGKHRVVFVVARCQHQRRFVVLVRRSHFCSGVHARVYIASRKHAHAHTHTHTHMHTHTHTHMQRVCIYLASAHVNHLHRVTARRPLYPRVRSLLPSAGRSSPECMHTTHTCMSTYLRAHIHAHVHIRPCLYACMYAHMHTYMHASKTWKRAERTSASLASMSHSPLMTVCLFVCVSYCMFVCMCVMHTCLT